MLRLCRLDHPLALGPGGGSDRLVQLLLEIQTASVSSPKSPDDVRTAAMVAMRMVSTRLTLPAIAGRAAQERARSAVEVYSLRRGQRIA